MGLLSSYRTNLLFTQGYPMFIFSIRFQIFALLFTSLFSSLGFAANNDFESLFGVRKKKRQAAKTASPSHNGFGYVDYKTLLLFHPAMRLYNFKVNNAYRPVPKNISVPLNFFLADREKKSVTQIRENQNMQTQARNQLKDLHSKSARLAREHQKQKNLLLRDKFANKEREFERLKREYQRELKEVQDEINATTEKIHRLYNESFGVHFLRIEERKSFLTAIEDEVLSTIEALRKEKKFLFILNNQVGHGFEPAKINTLAYRYTGFTGMNPLWKYLKRNQKLSSGENNSVRIGADVRDMQSMYDRSLDVSGIFQSPNLERFVLAGGVNLTLEVLEKIYQKHNYPDAQIRQLKLILSELRSEP